MIKLLIINPLIGLLLNNIRPSRYIGLIVSIISMYIILYINLKYNTNSNEFQFRDTFDLSFYTLSLGIDGLSNSILIIIGLIYPIIQLIISSEYKNNIEKIKGITNIILIMYIILIVVFTSLDLLFFFIFFELLLIPMFLLIGIYGSRINKIEATYRFFLYTLVGSLFLLLVILLSMFKYGTSNLEILQIKFTNEQFLNDPSHGLPGHSVGWFLKFIWFSIFFSFIVKIPMFPLHGWLPEAHTEAPTIGSIILAAILLKLATFGIYRYSLNMFNSFWGDSIYSYFLPFIFVLSIISILLASITAIRSIDLKKIIAYSSIAHMNFSIFGLFSNDLVGLSGASYLIFSHAFISSSLFLLIGILYVRYHSRILYYYKALFYTMPIFSFFFIYFSLANMSIPFTSAFISELLILLSSFQSNFFVSILLLLSILFSSCYVIWLTNRILFSSNSHISDTTTNGGCQTYLDLSISEFFSLFPMFLFTLIFGFYTKPLLNLYTLNLINILY